MKIAVIGAGISGLAAAFRLRQAGHQVVVLEAAARPGGKLFSEQAEGYLVEHAANGVLDKRAAVFALAKDAGLPDEHLRPAATAAKRRYLYTAEGLRALPTSPPAFLKSDLLSVSGRARALAEPLMPRRKKSVTEESVHAFFARRLGEEAAEAFADPFVTGIYGGDPQKLSVDAALPALPAMERDHGSLLRGMMAGRKEGVGPGGTLTTFAGGMGELVDVLAKSLGRALHLERPVTELRRANGGWLVYAAGGDPLAVDGVIITTPVAAASALLRPLSAAAGEALAGIPSAPVAVIGLGYREDQLPRPLDGFGFLVAKKAQRRLLGVLWTSSIFPGQAPPGHALLRIIAGGTRNPELLRLDDTELVRTVIGEVRETMGEFKGEPAFVRLVRWADGIPQYTLGHLDRVRQAEAALPGGVWLAGNGIHGVSVADCVARADALVGLLAH